MKKELIDYIEERAKVLVASDTSTQVTKDAAQAWLDAVATDATTADAATTALLDILEGRPTDIDGVIAFCQGPAVQLIGEEAAAQSLQRQLARKEAGAKWCDCDACTATTQILAKFGRVEL